MMIDYAQLKILTESAISLFCLLGAERIASAYTSFAKKYGQVDVNAAVISDLYGALSGKRDIDLSKAYQAIYDDIPDTEDYSDNVVDQAQCSAICTSYCVAFFSSGDFENVRNALGKVEDAIDVADIEVERRIEADVTWSNKLISILHSADLQDGSVIAQIRKDNLKAAVPLVVS